jgi:energy-coupling factor transporter ATP-binding protein EcfA2
MELVPKSRLTFSEVANELNAILFQPDIQAFRILLAAVAAHTLKPHGYPPVWLMIIGPAGSGKTTLLDTLNTLPVFRLNDLTPNTFLSGFKGNGKPSSLLHKLGNKPIITMKDFTTILSMRFEHKSEIMASLREIYDGFYRKATGMGDSLSWSGRLTLLTCCTPAIDRDRMTFRIMGDRFMEVRWSGPPSLALAHCVIDRHTEMDLSSVSNKIKAYVEACPLDCAALTGKQVNKLASLSHLVAVLRTPITRDEKGWKINDVGVPESPTRIAQALTSVVVTSATLDACSHARDEDMDLACRVARDSIPPMRLHILSLISKDGIPKDDDQLRAIPRWVRERTLDELFALGLIEETMGQAGDHWLHYSHDNAVLASDTLW